MPKFLGRFSNNGLTTFFGSTFLTANGAGATFLLELTTFFFGRGYKMLKKKEPNWSLISLKLIGASTFGMSINISECMRSGYERYAKKVRLKNDCGFLLKFNWWMHLFGSFSLLLLSLLIHSIYIKICCMFF